MSTGHPTLVGQKVRAGANFTDLYSQIPLCRFQAYRSPFTDPSLQADGKKIKIKYYEKYLSLVYFSYYFSFSQESSIFHGKKERDEISLMVTKSLLMKYYIYCDHHFGYCYHHFGYCDRFCSKQLHIFRIFNSKPETRHVK